MARAKPRIFLGLVEVAGYYGNLARGLRELGLEADFVSFTENKFAYPGASDIGPGLQSIRRLRGRLADSAQPLSRRLACYGFGYLVLVLIYFLWAAVRYDVFIFGFRTHFLPGMLDLPLLRLCGKRIIFVFHGSDSRPPYLSGNYFEASPQTLLRLTRRMRREIGCINRYAQHIVDHPPTTHFHRRPVVRWLAMGIPFSAPQIEARPAAVAAGRSLVAVHAPSRPREKGSQTIRAAVQALQLAGAPLELVELINRPNREVLETLAGCDFVIDELYSDTAMAGLATEAAWFGRPSVVGGYEIQDLLDAMALDEVPPAQVVRPERLREGIQSLMAELQRGRDPGRQAQAFVRGRWTPVEVARRYLRLITDGPPAEWLWDPAQTSFVHGWGLHAEQRDELLRRYVRACGSSALGLTDKPALERKLLEIAGAG
ncbi:MAG: hypothetical protein ACRETN_08665 [Nevskiales bacterium]